MVTVTLRKNYLYRFRLLAVCLTKKQGYIFWPFPSPLPLFPCFSILGKLKKPTNGRIFKEGGGDFAGWQKEYIPLQKNLYISSFIMTETSLDIYCTWLLAGALELSFLLLTDEDEDSTKLSRHQGEHELDSPWIKTIFC